MTEEGRNTRPHVGWLLLLPIGLCPCVATILFAWRGEPYVRSGERSLRDLVHAQDRFWKEDPDGDGPDYGTLAELHASGMIDPLLASGTKYGYRFQMGVSPVGSATRWMAVASPMHSGWAFFAVDQTGVIQRSEDKPFVVPFD